jgi:hypothetical protein
MRRVCGRFSARDWGKALLAVGTVFNGTALMVIRNMASVKI